MPKLSETTNHEPLSIKDIPELKKAFSIIHKINEKYKIIKEQRIIYETEKQSLSNDIITILELIGEMTDPLFACREKLESNYFTKISDPVLARKMFLNEYESMHKPYDQVKNIAWALYYKINNLKDDE